MKEFTAKEARDMADKSGTVSRETRSICAALSVQQREENIV